MDVTQRVPTAILFPEDLSLTTKVLDLASRKAQEGGVGNWLISRGAVVASIFTAAIDAICHAVAAVVKTLTWCLATSLYACTFRNHDIAPGANLWAISAHTARAISYAALTVGAPLVGLISPTKIADLVRSTLLSANVVVAPAAVADIENPQASVLAQQSVVASHHSVAPVQPAAEQSAVSVKTSPQSVVTAQPAALPVVVEQPVVTAQPGKCHQWKLCCSQLSSKVGELCRNTLNYAKAHPYKTAAAAVAGTCALVDGLSLSKGLVPYTEWTSSAPISRCLGDAGYAAIVGLGHAYFWAVNGAISGVNSLAGTNFSLYTVVNNTGA